SVSDALADGHGSGMGVHYAVGSQCLSDRRALRSHARGRRMSPVLSIVLTGRGGQGVKLSSELLAWSASADGFNPIQYRVYGALIRGGGIACSLDARR